MAGQILIVDPIAINRIVLRSRVSAACHVVAQAKSPEAALDQLRDTRPDLVLIGPGLDEADACHITEQLSSDPAGRGIPVLVLSRGLSHSSIRAALRAGAEDVIAVDTLGAFLLARIRRLLRQRGTLDELDARTLTERQIGLAEPAAQFEHPGSIAIVTSNSVKGRAWASALGPLLRHRLTCLDPQSALSLSESMTVPDLFIFEDQSDKPDEALRFLAEMRSRRACRTAAYIMVSNSSASPEDSGENRMAMALDIGANDVLRHGFDAQELALRTERHLARKRDDDRLRNRVRDGLREAVIDPLTGAFNRRYAMPHMTRIAERAVENGRSFAVMMIDLDRFKSVNDTFGHAAGDAVLVEVATRLREHIRGQDMLVRFGGEEFLIVLPETELDQVRLTAGRLCRIVADAPVSIGPNLNPIQVTVSIGIAAADMTELKQQVTAGKTTDEIRALLERADQALYSAKEQGRNMVTVSRSAA